MRTTICALILVVLAAQAFAGVTISVEKCEQLYDRLSKDDPWLRTQCGSSLAWGEAGVLQGILDLYEVTGNAKYLREIVRRGDRMVSHRDDARGFKDSTGKVHKAWSMAQKYTVAEGVLLDASGKPALELRSTCYAYNGDTKVEVVPSISNFTVTVTNSFFKHTETFAGLSLDPKSARYFAKIINNPEPPLSASAGDCVGPSHLLKVIPFSDKPGLPSAQTVTLKPLWLSYCGYIGIIYHPLLRFAEIVRADPSLKEFAPAAQRFTKAADESYTEFRSHFRVGPKSDEGYYITCERGGAFPYDNLPEPFNYHGGHLSAEAALYRLTGKAVYKDHVRRMANLLKHRLKLMPGDLYVWTYWFEPLNEGYSRGQVECDNYPVMPPKASVEDNSHGQLDILLAMQAKRMGIAFDEVDLNRFANTFLKNVYVPGQPGFNAKVDGTPGAVKYTNAGITGWLPLAEVNPAVYDACREVYEKRGKDSFTGLARLLLIGKSLGRDAVK